MATRNAFLQHFLAKPSVFSLTQPTQRALDLCSRMPYKHQTAQHHGGSTCFAAGQPQNLAVVLKSVGLQAARQQHTSEARTAFGRRELFARLADQQASCPPSLRQRRLTLLIVQVALGHKPQKPGTHTHHTCPNSIPCERVSK